MMSGIRDPETAPPPGKGLRGTAIETLFLLITLTALMIVTVKSTVVMDGDIWWHLRVGHWILENHAVPVVNTFSSHAAGQPWIAYSWFFEVLVSKIFDSWGYRGISMFITFAVLAYTAWLIVFFARFMNLPRAMILSFLCCLALMPLRTPRPWHFTILFFAIELSLLWIAREENRPLWLLPLVPLFIFWANIHIQFVYGLALLGLFALEESIPERWREFLGTESRPARRPMRMWLLLACCSLATLINPYGWSLYNVALQYGNMKSTTALVQDVQAMPFRSISNWIVLAMVLGAVFVIGSARRKNLLLILLLAVGCFFGFRAQRDAWFPVTIAALTLGLAIRASSPSELVQSRWTFLIAILLSFPATSFLLAHDGRFSDSELQQTVAKTFPVKASDYVISHNLQGPLFNSYNWGGYLMWRLPQMLVSIDGRGLLFEDFLATAAETITGGQRWSQDPDLKRARTLVIEADGPLASILRVNPDFRLVYEDKTAAIFQPIK